MAKDDYFTIVYYLLKYLYACVKEGIQPREDMIMLKEYICDINESYAQYILITMQENGYISGIDTINAPILGKGMVETIKSISKIKITPVGIEYLNNNNMMNKAYDTLKKFKDLIPFI